MKYFNMFVVICNLFLAIAQIIRELRLIMSSTKEYKYQNKIDKRFKKFKGLDSKFLTCLSFSCPNKGNKNIKIVKVGNKYVHYICKDCNLEFIKEIEEIKEEYKKDDD